VSATPTTDYELCKLVKRNSSLASSSALQVADHIASYYNSAKGYSVVSADVLARETRQNRTTVLYNIEEMEKSGEWIVERKPGVPNRYRPVLALLRDPSRKQLGETSKARKNPLSENLSKAVETDPKVVDEDDVAQEKMSIPQTSYEANDPQSELPLYADNGLSSGDYPVVAVPGELQTNSERAQRLLKRIAAVSKGKMSLTESKLVKTYESLETEGYPVEAIDILLWHQLENAKGINHKFLSLVLSKCVTKGEIVEPTSTSPDGFNPAVDAATMVYNIKQARKMSGKPKFVESL
jgi:hypothetical protein